MQGTEDRDNLDLQAFKKFRRFYFTAIIIIVATLLLIQFVTQRQLQNQLNDSHIVNIAGRQRMLSQKIVKEVLYLFQAEGDHSKSKERLLKDVNTFSEAHQNLQDIQHRLGDLTRQDKELKKQFHALNSSQNQLVNLVDELVFVDSLVSIDRVRKKLELLSAAENRFLHQMDDIVFRLDDLSKAKVTNLKKLNYALLIIVLLVLLLEGIFLFKPLSIQIKKLVSNLIVAQKKTENELNQVNHLYQAKESLLQELQGLYYAIDNAALFISIGQDNQVIHISKKFARLLEIDASSATATIEELLTVEEAEQEKLKNLLARKQNSVWFEEIQITTLKGRKIWLEVSIISINQINNDQNALILCNDITVRKESQDEIDKLNKQKFEREIQSQKNQASQIVEAQEEERKRIAKDIHDGIGQTLTALKFNLESIDVKNIEKVQVKVDRLKGLLSSLIKEVRTVTFNLTPPELQDFGIVATLQKLVQQLNNFTGKEIYFQNKTDFNGRFDSLVEINLYRVVQEAVNNALKYANSNCIIVSLSHSKDKLSIVIDDDGVGFDMALLKTKENGVGMGLFFMRERIHYINGRIFISSSPGNGTRITINIDL